MGAPLRKLEKKRFLQRFEALQIFLRGEGDYVCPMDCEAEEKAQPPLQRSSTLQENLTSSPNGLEPSTECPGSASQEAEKAVGFQMDSSASAFCPITIKFRTQFADIFHFFFLLSVSHRLQNPKKCNSRTCTSASSC